MGKAKELTVRQWRFLNAVNRGETPTAAAIEAGYSEATAEQQALQLMRHPDIAQRLADNLQRRSERTEIQADDILRELYRLATVDIGLAYDESGCLKKLHDIPSDVRRAMAAVEVDELHEGSGPERRQVGITTKVKFWDKNKSLELLGKNLKLWTDKLDVSGQVSLGALIDEAAKKTSDE